MVYLSKVTVKTGELFNARFASGAETPSHDVACYFLVMQEKCIGPGELDAYIRLGEMMDPSHDWREIRRIAATFTTAKGAAA